MFTKFFLGSLVWASFAVASPAKVTLMLNWKPEPEFGGFYAAELNGEFKKKKSSNQN